VVQMSQSDKENRRKTNRGPSMMIGGVQWGENRYPSLWIYEAGETFSVSLHRLCAYAHGKIDSIRYEKDDREIHHIDGNKWNNNPENLEALSKPDHTRITFHGDD